MDWYWWTRTITITTMPTIPTTTMPTTPTPRSLWSWDPPPGTSSGPPSGRDRAFGPTWRRCKTLVRHLLQTLPNTVTIVWKLPYANHLHNANREVCFADPRRSKDRGSCTTALPVRDRRALSGPVPRPKTAVRRRQRKRSQRQRYRPTIPTNTNSETIPASGSWISTRFPVCREPTGLLQPICCTTCQGGMRTYSNSSIDDIPRQRQRQRLLLRRNTTRSE
mmetsp:Transcript_15398/g.33193  ORF Transcript_15398/g.33193 Transcript_15398/m.33193 type:complete len:221 (-) Transcript_15398:1073-1735(-)